ncbi:MAG: hypothetical protein HND55_00705 [Pseudomonadota bacterium]|nr:MAG: hypothetical protein HND55_00705 [Pseudomonadota bacterium]
MREVSDLLSIHEDRDKPATKRHRGFAEYFGVESTRYVGKKRLFELVFGELAKPGREADLALWFTFRVYRELTGASDTAPAQHPSDPKLVSIANRLSDDEKVIQSIRRYRGEDLIWFGQWTSPEGFTYTGGSNRTAAYKAASSEIKTEFGLAKPSPKSSISSKAPSKASGCLGVLALASLMPTGVGFSIWLLIETLA